MMAGNRDDKVFRVAHLAAILLAGRGYYNDRSASPASHHERLAMLEQEKRIAISEAQDLLKMADQVVP